MHRTSISSRIAKGLNTNVNKVSILIHLQISILIHLISVCHYGVFCGSEYFPKALYFPSQISVQYEGRMLEDTHGLPVIALTPVSIGL
jgi:hypothetical protein